MWERAWDFIRMVGGVIVVGSVVVWFLQAFPQDIKLSQDYEGRITRMEAEAQTPERDQAIVELKQAASKERVEKSYLGRMGQSVAPVFSALGFDWKDTVAIITGFFAKEVVVASYAVLYAQDEGGGEGSEGLRNALAKSMSPVTALGLMVFLLLYSPCLSTMAVIRREAGSWGWAGFSVVFSLTVGWVMAFGVVTIGNMVV